MDVQIFNLKDCMFHVVEIISAYALTNQNAIILEFSKDFPPIAQGDNQKFEQLLMNLLYKILGLMRGETIEIYCSLERIDINNLFHVKIDITIPRIKFKNIDIVTHIENCLDEDLKSKILEKITNKTILQIGIMFIKPMTKILKGEIKFYTEKFHKI